MSICQPPAMEGTLRSMKNTALSPVLEGEGWVRGCRRQPAEQDTRTALRAAPSTPALLPAGEKGAKASLMASGGS